VTATDGPFCQRGFKCGERDRRAEHIHQHTAACPLSDTSAMQRQARIDALTREEMRTLLVFLSGWVPIGTDFGLAGADTVRELLPEHMPEGAL
jgi:hypothetical protein